VTPLFVGVLYGTFLYSIYVDGDLRKRLASIRDAEWAVYRYFQHTQPLMIPIESYIASFLTLLFYMPGRLRMKLSSIQPFQTPSRPMNWRRRCYDLVSSTRYKAGMAVLVVLHCIMREGFYADQVSNRWCGLFTHGRSHHACLSCII
jgi:hypothetical protein